MRALALLSLLLVGCIQQPVRHPGLVGGPPPDPVKWAACEKVRVRQGVLQTLGGALSFGAGIGGLAGDRAVGNTGQLAIGITGVGLAVAGGLLSAFGGMAASTYTRDLCPSVPPP